MKFFPAAALLFSVLLPACATSPQEVEQKQAAAAAEATDECLANPSLAKNWGECNVKSVIFEHKEGIETCHQKFQKPSDPKGTLVLKIRIKKDGGVRAVSADTSSRPQNKSLENCLSREIGKAHFAAPPKGVRPTIFYPYQL